MALKSFPRGGEKPAIKKTFHVLRNEEHKSKKKPKTQAEKDNNTDNNTEYPTAIIAERLLHTTICEGMVILGQISKIFEYRLIVSIPGGMLGHVQITNISESYTNLLQNVIDLNNTHSNELKSLSDLYNIGDHVICYVKNINFKEKWLYNLSLEPQLINRNIYDSHLIEDMKIVCTIKSTEDHGYVVDTGIANVRAFLPIKNIDKGKQYFPGNQLFCHIKKIETADNISVVKLSAKKKKVNNISTHDVSLDVLTPKTKLQLYVTKVLSNGLQVTFGKKYIGYVNQIYLQNPLSTYTEDMTITGTLLYILPVLSLTVKVAYFSLLSDTPEEEKLNVGDIISKAKVLYRESNGIVFKLSKSGLRGFVSLRKTNVSSSKIPTEFQEGSVHKCRILSYNWMEHLYVCTMEHKILKQKYFSVSDITFGDILDVTINNIDIKSGFVQVQVGKICGAVQPEHISDIGLNALYKLNVGNIVKARVLKNDKFGVKFTLKKSLINSKLPVLHDIHDAQCGSKYHGTVVKIEKTGMLVRFYGNVKGWVARTVSSNNVYDMSWNYSLGQTVTVCIVHIEKDEEKIKLKIVDEKQNNIDLSIGEIVEGTVTISSANGIYLTIKDRKDEDIIGFLPANHMAPDSEIGSLLSTKYTFGDKISAFVFSKEPSLILSRTFVSKEQYKSFDLLKVGDCIPCTIKDILEDGVKVILPIENYSKYGFVSYKNISNFNLLQLNQILFVKIIAINKREKQLTLAMLLRELWDSVPVYEVKMMTIVDILILYLSKLSELAGFYKNKPISSVTLGQNVIGTVNKITKHGVILHLDNHLITGIVHKQHYSENLKVGDKVQGTILWKNYFHDFVDVSILSRIVNSISPKQETLPQLPTEVVLSANILMITNWFLLVSIKYKGIGYLAVLPVRRHINDLSVDVTPYKIHAKIEVYVVLKGNETNTLPICLLKSVFKFPKNETTNKKVMIESASVTKKLKRKNSSEEQDSTSQIIKKSKMEHQKDDVITENEQDHSKKNKKKELDKTKVKCNNKQNDKVENKICKDKDIIEKKIEIKDTDELQKNSNANKIKKDKSLTKLHIPECEFHWDNKPSQASRTNVETSSDEEEESKQKRKKLSATEHHKLQEKCEILGENISTSQVPNSIDQFDKLVLTNPDNSSVWLQYIDHHLQAMEIDEARAIAKQALKTIDCKKENERLNVWKAWLNLESRYGTTESLNDTFHEAVRTNDDFNIYTHMLTLYTDSGRQTELNQLITTMIGKFKENLETWVACGTALLKIDLKKKSRHIMQRALQSLPDSQHINLLVKFAILENMYGDKERAEILFENILNSYPERFDVWLSYLDCLFEKRDIDTVRRALEKVCNQEFSVRKMKTLFKKFMTFEEKFGTPEGKIRILELANAYVNENM